MVPSIYSRDACLLTCSVLSTQDFNLPTSETIRMLFAHFPDLSVALALSPPASPQSPCPMGRRRPTPGTSGTPRISSRTAHRGIARNSPTLSSVNSASSVAPRSSPHSSSSYFTMPAKLGSGTPKSVDGKRKLLYWFSQRRSALPLPRRFAASLREPIQAGRRNNHTPRMESKEQI